jgi:hypothetical protein
MPFATALIKTTIRTTRQNGLLDFWCLEVDALPMGAQKQTAEV